MRTIYTHAHFAHSVGDFGIPEELSSWLEKKACRNAEDLLTGQRAMQPLLSQIIERLLLL